MSKRQSRERNEVGDLKVWAGPQPMKDGSPRRRNPTIRVRRLLKEAGKWTKEAKDNGRMERFVLKWMALIIKRSRTASKARASLEGREELSPQDLRHQLTLSQSKHETQEKSCEQSFYSKAPKSSHPVPKDSQATSERFDANSPCRKLIGWLNKEEEVRSQRTQREGSQKGGEEVESHGRISVYKRMHKNASQRLGPRTEEFGESSGCSSNEDARDILKLRKDMEELKKQIDRDGSFGPTVKVISPFTTRMMKAKLHRGFGSTLSQCLWRKILAEEALYSSLSLKQKEGETNTELVQRWNEAINEVEPMDDKTSIALFMSALRSGELFRRLDYDAPTSYKAMMAKVDKFCATEESDRLKSMNEGALHEGSEKKNEKASATTLSIPTLKSLVPGEATPVAEIKGREEGG
ncbi:unnamed protein product [Cuscuta campestris]|uniref:Retrotransposon gag domain-containing protein n=1 Tax=Cuscuta campestris TaxID=132261 RepID=A0A484KXX5_9ASTE|nr:unnamed protein product [Cuscuta campestris]